MVSTAQRTHNQAVDAVQQQQQQPAKKKLPTAYEAACALARYTTASYKPTCSIERITLKLPNRHLSDLPPLDALAQCYAPALRARDMSLLGLYAREGCVLLVLDVLNQGAQITSAAASFLAAALASRFHTGASSHATRAIPARAAPAPAGAVSETPASGPGELRAQAPAEPASAARPGRSTAASAMPPASWLSPLGPLAQGQDVTLQLSDGTIWGVRLGSWPQARRVETAARPDLICVSPMCWAAGARAQALLYACVELQAAPGAGADAGLVTHVRCRGQYLDSRSVLVSDHMPAEALGKVLPRHVLPQGEVLCVSLPSLPPQPGLMWVECQRGNVLGNPQPVLLAPSREMWAELQDAMGMATISSQEGMVAAQRLVLDLGLWLEVHAQMADLQQQGGTLPLPLPAPLADSPAVAAREVARRHLAVSLQGGGGGGGTAARRQRAQSAAAAAAGRGDSDVRGAARRDVGRPTSAGGGQNEAPGAHVLNVQRLLRSSGSRSRSSSAATTQGTGNGPEAQRAGGVIELVAGGSAPQLAAGLLQGAWPAATPESSVSAGSSRVSADALVALLAPQAQASGTDSGGCGGNSGGEVESCREAVPARSPGGGRGGGTQPCPPAPGAQAARQGPAAAVLASTAPRQVQHERQLPCTAIHPVPCPPEQSGPAGAAGADGVPGAGAAVGEGSSLAHGAGLPPPRRQPFRVLTFPLSSTDSSGNVNGGQHADLDDSNCSSGDEDHATASGGSNGSGRPRGIGGRARRPGRVRSAAAGLLQLPVPGTSSSSLAAETRERLRRMFSPVMDIADAEEPERPPGPTPRPSVATRRPPAGEGAGVAAATTTAAVAVHSNSAGPDSTLSTECALMEVMAAAGQAAGGNARQPSSASGRSTATNNHHLSSLTDGDLRSWDSISDVILAASQASATPLRALAAMASPPAPQQLSGAAGPPPSLPPPAHVLTTALGTHNVLQPVMLSQTASLTANLLAFALRRGWLHTTLELLSGARRLRLDLEQLNDAVMSREGLGLLHLAVISKKPAVLQALLHWRTAAGAAAADARQQQPTALEVDLATCCVAGLSPLHLAAVLDDGGGIARELLGAAPSACCLWFTLPSEDGATPADLARHTANAPVNDAALEALQRLAAQRAQLPRGSDAAARAELAAEVVRGVTATAAAAAAGAQRAPSSHRPAEAPLQQAAAPAAAAQGHGADAPAAPPLQRRAFAVAANALGAAVASAGTALASIVSTVDAEPSESNEPVRETVDILTSDSSRHTWTSGASGTEAESPGPEAWGPGAAANGNNIPSPFTSAAAPPLPAPAPAHSPPAAARGSGTAAVRSAGAGARASSQQPGPALARPPGRPPLRQRAADLLRMSVLGAPDTALEAKYKAWRVQNLYSLDRTCGCIFTVMFLLPAISLAAQRDWAELLAHVIFNVGLLAPYALRLALPPARLVALRDVAVLGSDVGKALLAVLILCGLLPYPKAWRSFTKGNMDMMMLVVMKPLSEQTSVPIALLQHALAVGGDAHIYAYLSYEGRLGPSLLQALLQNLLALALLVLLDMRSRSSFLQALAAEAGADGGRAGAGCTAAAAAAKALQ